MRLVRIAALLTLVAAAVAFPQVFSDPLTTQISVFTLIYAIMATAWNILAGYTGYFSLGHAAFFGVGAYTLGLICQQWSIPGGYGPFLLLPVAGLVAALIAVPVGAVALRTRRHVFVVLTISILFIGQLLAFNLRDLTGGSTGLPYPTPPWMGGAFNLPFYYVGLVILLATLGVSGWIRYSKFGLGLLAIRDDEDRALGLGVRTGVSKLAAFVLAAFFIAMAGGLYGYFVSYIYPAVAFNPLDDLSMALIAFAGGLGTLFGPVLAACIIEPAHEKLALDYGASDLYLVFYGALFLVIILLMPQGLLPSLSRRWAQLVLWRRRRAAGPQEEGPIAPQQAVGSRQR
ncbi:MAG: branched-chain amino acid ABC transporter permease [Chloroflexi bacterium]|nr:branched-chain amino acid ABC transporter permease [Chloroflexota bacterium]